MKLTTLFPPMLALVLAVTAAAQDACGQEFSDFTAPEFPKPTDSQSAYVDMQQINGRFCPDHPFRPGWVMVQPRGYQWKTGILQELYNLKRTRAVVEEGQCSCDLMFPSWEDMRPELEQFLERFPGTRASQFTSDQRKLVLDIERELQQEKRAMASEFRQLCRPIIMGE